MHSIGIGSDNVVELLLLDVLDKTIPPYILGYNLFSWSAPLELSDL